MDESCELSGSESLGEGGICFLWHIIDHCMTSYNSSLRLGMPSGDHKCGSPSLPRKLLEYITEVHRRSGVKLDVAKAHAASIELELDSKKQEEEKNEEMDMFSRPRSRTSGFQATSPLAIAQRRNAAETTQQRPKSAYLLNGHCELNSSSSARDQHDGYHTDGEETHQVTVSGYQRTINHYRRMYEEAPLNNNLLDSQQFSSASSICSSDDEEINHSWLSFRKSQSDIGTMRVQSVEQNSELLEKIKMLEKQNEMLKQHLEDKTMKDEATQVQHYYVVSVRACVCACVHVCCVCVCVCTQHRCGSLCVHADNFMTKICVSGPVDYLYRITCNFEWLNSRKQMPAKYFEKYLRKWKDQVFKTVMLAIYEMIF